VTERASGRLAHKKCISKNPKVLLWKTLGGPSLTCSDIQKNRPVKQKLKVAAAAVVNVSFSACHY